MYLTWVFLLGCISGLGAVPILMSWTTSIKFFEETDINNITSVTPTTTFAIALDYHYRRGEIYYSEGVGRINRRKLKPTEDSREKPDIIAEVKLCDGLAVDWVSDNLYWTDVTAHKVEMATLDGLFRRTLFKSSDGVEKPRGIVLDPHNGLMFWTDWGKNPKVESSGLDGGDKRTLVSSDLVWPNGVTLDLNRKKLYILDGFLSKLSSCDYDGSNLRMIKTSQDTLQQAFAVTFYGNRLYWASWRHHTLFSMDIGSENTQSIYKRIGGRMVERMMGVKAVNPTLQMPSSATNPCKAAGCSHKCLVSRSISPSCICPLGFSLQLDGKTCTEEGYLVTSWRKTIRRFDLNATIEEPLIDSATAAISIDYHLKKNLIFWTDIEEHRIYRAPLGQLNNKTAILTTEQSDGLAVDWVHDVIYWTDTFHNTLEAAELDGTKRKTIVSQDLEEPRAIAIDPHSRYIFWSDWGTSPKIERAFLDGSARQTIISYDIAWPNGMTLDLNQKRVYWVDGKLASISYCNYDGSNRKSILNSDVFPSQPFGIDLFQDKIYWTDWKSQSLFKASKDHITELNRLANFSSTIMLRPNGVKVVHSSRQPEGENSCASVNCKDICLGGPVAGKGYCMGKLQEERPDIDYKIELPAELTSKVSNNSILLALSGKIPTLAAITVKCIRRLGCSEDKRCSEGGEQLKVFTSQNTFNITDLLPATEYSVNFQSSDHNEILQLSTKMTDPPETPKISSISVQNKIVKIKWDPVDICIPGSNNVYNYRVLKNIPTQDVALAGKTVVTEANLTDIEPGDYLFQVYTYNANYSSSAPFSIKTDESEGCKEEALLCDGTRNCPDGSDEDVTLCAGLERVIIYKKNSSVVHFRCQVQNRTVKHLEKFMGNYTQFGSSDSQRFSMVAEPCVMWPESYCFSISGLSRNKLYNFSISAALRDGRFGNPVEVSASTREEASGPPEDVKIASYTPTSVLIEWRYPNQSNGEIKSFIINILEVETFGGEGDSMAFPIIESPANDEEATYVHEAGGFLPATTYAISISAKNMYIGGSTTIDANTPPSPMDIMRRPDVQISSTPPLSWKPQEDPPADLPQYHSLIKSYLLLLLPVKGDEHTTSDLGPLQPVLESKIGSGFKVLWHKNVEDKEAFKQPIKLDDLELRKQYQLAWVQVSQYKDAYGIDYILSNHFIAV